MPGFALASGSALLVASAANALARSGRPGGVPLFWLALLGLVALAGLQLASREPSRGERIGIVLLTGITLYLFKVVKEPFAFTLSDEFVHAYNAIQVIDTGFLLGENPIIRVTPQYTGLGTVTSAVASLTGLSVFGAGLVVIGAARLLMMLGLFLLFETVSGSSRIAGLGALIYAANPNYLFFTAQYAYESLALPLFLLAAAGVVRWMRREHEPIRSAWVATALMAATAVVMTHHMTTYALLAFALALSAAHALVARGGALSNPWPFAAFVAGAMVGWLILVASDTAGYITLIFTKALESAVQTISRETEPRRLFVTDSGFVEGPAGERFIGLAAVLLIGLALLVGLREVWRHYRRAPAAILLGVMATGYLGTLTLRFVPNAWEIGARSSEFLFIGVGFIVALALVRVTEHGRRAARALVAGAVALLVAGGIIAGWPYDLRLALPYRIAANGEVLEPQGARAADWSVSALGTGVRIGADESNARLLLVRGQSPLTGSNPNVGEVILYARLTQGMVNVLTRNDIRYLVMDRRRVRDDKAVGYFFTSLREKRAGVFPTAWTSKFDRQPGVSRIYDSGDLAIYDIGGLRFDPEFP